MRGLALVVALFSVPAFAADYSPWPGRERSRRMPQNGVELAQQGRSVLQALHEGPALRQYLHQHQAASARARRGAHVDTYLRCMRSAPAQPVQFLSLLALGAASAQAIDVGDVFWLSSSGAGLTVTGTALAQPGVVRVEYRLTLENASEYCQRYGQHARLTPQHDKCVAETIGSSRARTALVNCPAQVIVLEFGFVREGQRPLLAQQK